ncbi:MAG: hypothetical protein ACI936_001979 [Paraglaciecola sp.]|jgi:hypothetical protein
MLGGHDIPVEKIHIKVGSAANLIPSLAIKYAARGKLLLDVLDEET